MESVQAWYAIGSVLLVSLVSVIMAVPFLLKKKISSKVLLFLLSISVGVLLSTVFLDFLPESLAEGYHFSIALYILGGFIFMFLLEKLVHYHHNKKCEEDAGHSHAYSLAPVNLVGDGVHNLIDGLVIAASYSVNITVGIAATISIIFHELPQELADFGVLLFSGMSRLKAIVFNLLSAGAAIVGTVIGIILAGQVDGFTSFIIPFAAGNLIYIAASNLVPQLHRECKLKDTALHLLAIVIGITIIALVTFLGP